MIVKKRMNWQQIATSYLKFDKNDIQFEAIFGILDEFVAYKKELENHTRR
jgi:hypothetical protein